jgi:hypothetical protein
MRTLKQKIKHNLNLSCLCSDNFTMNIVESLVLKLKRLSIRTNEGKQISDKKAIEDAIIYLRNVGMWG